MSWLPISIAWVVMIGILSIFMWKLWSLFIFFLLVLLVVVWLIKESVYSDKHHAVGFWLFIISEVVAFGTLFCLCVMTVEDDIDSISSPLELPLLGCFVLTGSSITVTTYHHFIGSAYSSPFLLLTIILGSSFIGLQIFEFYECGCDITFCVYDAVCFCTVGLHFLHVLGGLVALSLLYVCGDGSVPQSNVDFVVWYWHFVDYIWLFVYLIIYLS